jgi:phenol hydroxylase P0 protein
MRKPLQSPTSSHRALDAAQEPLVCDIARKFVRIKETRPDGLVVFEFSIGWPEQMVELVLPSAAFDEFCATNQVQRLQD